MLNMEEKTMYWSVLDKNVRKIPMIYTVITVRVSASDDGDADGEGHNCYMVMMMRVS